MVKEKVCIVLFFRPMLFGVVYSRSMKRIIFICAHCYKPFQRIPIQFARENGLINKKCGVVIKDERQRSWNLRLATWGSRVHILGGWSKLRIANDLKEGDHMMFEVIANGKKPIWRFRSKFFLFSIQTLSFCQ